MARKINNKNLLILCFLLLFSGGCEKNSDREFICDVKNNTINTNLITGEKTTSESFSTWHVRVNVSEGKLLFGTGDFLNGCSPKNSFYRLTINESNLLCQEEYKGKTRFEGGESYNEVEMKINEMDLQGAIHTTWEYPESVIFNRHSLRFTRTKDMTFFISWKDGHKSSYKLGGDQSGICKEGKRKF